MNGTRDVLAPHRSTQTVSGYAGKRLCTTYRLVVMVLASCMLSGCVTGAQPDVDPVGSNYERIEVPPASGDPVVPARQAFAAGNYAHAARYFEQAVRKDSIRKEALLGLAASYDQIGRFDLSDSVYEKAASIMPDDPALLNNIGYSHLLRGDLQNAQAYFDQSLKLEPTNPTVNGNRRLLVEVARNVPFQAAMGQ